MFWWHLLTSPQNEWVGAAAVLGQSHVALNSRTLAGIGCEQIYISYKKDQMQVSISCKSFSTTWYPEQIKMALYSDLFNTVHASFQTILVLLLLLFICC